VDLASYWKGGGRVQDGTAMAVLMADGTWSVACRRCRRSLGRGLRSDAEAARVLAGHRH
jgi:hypothetical protein